MKQAAKLETIEMEVSVNGRTYREAVESRKLLSDFLREDCGLTGTHVGCEHGVCGACTVLVDGAAVRSCLLFAVQVDGATVHTVEGLSDTQLGSQLQHSFSQCHALQCGFCTPGILMSSFEFLTSSETPSVKEISEMLSGHLCRCTGYTTIVEAIQMAADAALGGK